MATDDMQEEFASIHVAIGVVSAVCDYAKENDGKGFNAADAWLGHNLAEMPAGLWTSDAALAAWDMLRKYRGQLAAASIDYDQLPRPDGANELEAERREQARERARERVRQWREQKYRKSRSYVRCDGDGAEIVLSFAYDPGLVAESRKIEGRIYDGATKTNLYPFTSLPEVIKFADDHDIEVTADVRALAAIAADRAAEQAAQPKVRLDSDGTIIIDASLDYDVYQALKEANNDQPTMDYKAKVHRLPLYLATGLLELAEEAGLTVSDEARAAIHNHIEQQGQIRAEASAFVADPVPIPGLADGLMLKPQQYPVVRFALKHRRILIGDDMGWGKTLSSLAAAAADNAYPAVVVCRPSLTLNWSAEIRRFFPNLAIYEASGTTPQLVPAGTDVIIIGSAALAAKPSKTKTGGKEFGWVAELAKVAPKALIIDEGQDTKERTANRSQACAQLAANISARDGLVLDLTGTAILNRPRELCQQLEILGRLDEFGGLKKFLWRYCLAETNRFGADYNGARNLIELSDRLREWGIMIRRSDDAALGLPPCREHVLVVPQADLNPDTMVQYQKAEADLLEFLAEQARQAAERLGKNPNSAAVEAAMRAASAEHLVAINTLRQLAGRAKREYVTRWVRSHVDSGEKVMVAAHHRSEVDAYAAEFGGLKLQGGQSVADKEKAKATFQGKSAADAPVISVAIGAGGVGHTLTAARIGIQAEQAWTPGETQQMKKRLHRIGQDRAVDYYITVAEGTIDEQLRNIVTSKQKTLDAVLDGRANSGANTDETSIAAELTWRLTQQGLGNPVSGRHDEALDSNSSANEEQNEIAGPGLVEEADSQRDDDRTKNRDVVAAGSGRRPAAGFRISWPMTAEEGRMTDALSRGESVPGGPGACATCGHLTLWHRPNRARSYHGQPCEKCDCQAFQVPYEADPEVQATKPVEDPSLAQVPLGQSDMVKIGRTAEPDAGLEAATVRTARPTLFDAQEGNARSAAARISPQSTRGFAHQYLDAGLQPVPAWGARQDGACCCPRGVDCARPGKHPRAVHSGPGERDYSWKPLACTTHEEVDDRFADGSEYATGNLMVAIPAGLMAIDVDDDDGGRAAVEALAEGLGELPPTLGHTTPHGEHQIYQTPPGWVGRAWVGKDPANPVPPGIDLRMPGQLLMAAPSEVPAANGVDHYGPVAIAPIASLPAAYLEAWTPPRLQPQAPAHRVPVPPDNAGRAAKYVSDSMTRIVEDLAAREAGGRNAAAYAAGLKAGSLLGAARTTPGAEAAAWTEEQAEQALLEAARHNGYTDKDGEAEALRAIRSGLRNGLRRPRTLPDFTAHRSTPDQGHRTQSSAGRRSSQAPGEVGAAKRWQDLVPADVRREVEAADSAAAARRRAAIVTHQQAIERHDHAATDATAAEVERTRVEAATTHQEYIKDGRHVTGRHDAAMLRWADSVTARRIRAVDEPVPGDARNSREQADAAATAADEAYQAGDLDQAIEHADRAAEFDPSRADLWQQYRDQISARRAILTMRQAAQGKADRQQAEELLEQTRQIDSRIRARALWDSGNLPPAETSRSQPQAGQETPAGQRQQPPQRQQVLARSWPLPPARRSQSPSELSSPKESSPNGARNVDRQAVGDVSELGREHAPSSPRTIGNRWPTSRAPQGPSIGPTLIPGRHSTHDPDPSVEPELF